MPKQKNPVHQLGEPLLIVHREEGEIHTILFNFEGHKPEAYGLIVADIIGHVAKAYDCDPAYVLEWAQRELYSPTTGLTRIGPN